MDRESVSVDAASERRDFARARLNFARSMSAAAMRSNRPRRRHRNRRQYSARRTRRHLAFIHGRKAIRCFDLYQARKREHSEARSWMRNDFPEYFAALEVQRAIAAVEQ